MRILVTGSSGFIGCNLIAELEHRGGVDVLRFEVGDPIGALTERGVAADVIFHLAGVNRPPQIEDFQKENAGLTCRIVDLLLAAGKNTPIILSSSTQAALDNPYGQSKRASEDAVFAYGRATGAPVFVFRLPNVFGKWSRPNYNSAVATFCHNVARDIPITVNDPAAPITLVYIDDVLEAFLGVLVGQVLRDGVFCTVPSVYSTTVGEVAGLIRSFRAGRGDLSLPVVEDGLAKKLYATYLSFLPEDAFSYSLTMHCDARGSFTEFLRTPERGQVSINISKPGITKGNHWHHTKHEKFLVVSGRAVIRFRKVGAGKVLTYDVSGERLEVVDIPPGYTHSITNSGEGDLVTVIWVSEPYIPAHPDTWFEEV